MSGESLPPQPDTAEIEAAGAVDADVDATFDHNQDPDLGNSAVIDEARDDAEDDRSTSDRLKSTVETVRGTGLRASTAIESSIERALAHAPGAGRTAGKIALAGAVLASTLVGYGEHKEETDFTTATTTIDGKPTQTNISPQRPITAGGVTVRDGRNHGSAWQEIDSPEGREVTGTDVTVGVIGDRVDPVDAPGEVQFDYSPDYDVSMKDRFEALAEMSDLVHQVPVETWSNPDLQISAAGGASFENGSSATETTDTNEKNTLLANRRAMIAVVALRAVVQGELGVDIPADAITVTSPFEQKLSPAQEAQRIRLARSNNMTVDQFDSALNRGQIDLNDPDASRFNQEMESMRIGAIEVRAPGENNEMVVKTITITGKQMREIESFVVAGTPGYLREQEPFPESEEVDILSGGDDGSRKLPNRSQRRQHTPRTFTPIKQIRTENNDNRAHRVLGRGRSQSRGGGNQRRTR